MDDQTITVTGVGRVMGDPDTMVVTIGVEVVAPTVREASGTAAEAAGALIAALRANGVDDRDLRTRDFSVAPQYDYPSEGRPRLAGYQVTNSVVAQVRELAQAGATIDAAIEAGGDLCIVRGVEFEVRDETEWLVTARGAAYADALARAQQLASLAGRELAGVVRIVESNGSAPRGGIAPMMMGKAFAATPVQPGQVTSEVQLDIVFALSPPGVA